MLQHHSSLKGNERSFSDWPWLKSAVKHLLIVYFSHLTTAQAAPQMHLNLCSKNYLNYHPYLCPAPRTQTCTWAASRFTKIKPTAFKWTPGPRQREIVFLCSHVVLCPFVFVFQCFYATFLSLWKFVCSHSRFLSPCGSLMPLCSTISLGWGKYCCKAPERPGHTSCVCLASALAARLLFSSAGKLATASGCSSNNLLSLVLPSKNMGT